MITWPRSEQERIDTAYELAGLDRDKPFKGRALKSALPTEVCKAWQKDSALLKSFIAARATYHPPTVVKPKGHTNGGYRGPSIYDFGPAQSAQPVEKKKKARQRRNGSAFRKAKCMRILWGEE